MAESSKQYAPITSGNVETTDTLVHDRSAGGASEDAGNPPTKPKKASKSFEAIKKLNVEKVIVLSFRTLQLKRIAELQDELLNLSLGAAAQQTSERDKIDKALSAYAKALRNHETLSQQALPIVPHDAKLIGFLAEEVSNPKADGPVSDRSKHFMSMLVNLFAVLVLTPKSKDTRDLERYISQVQQLSLPSTVVQYVEKEAGTLGFRELDQRGREQRSQRNAFTQRIVMAMFGGAALIGPMLIMTLHPSRNTSLITISVATFLFALVLAFIARDSAGKDVLAATAAYAAVLVVFVGTSTPVSLKVMIA